MRIREVKSDNKIGNAGKEKRRRRRRRRRRR